MTYFMSYFWGPAENWGDKKIKTTSFHQYPWNSEVETTWISLIGCRDDTIRHLASFFNIPTRNVQNMENKIMMETLWAINRHYSYITNICIFSAFLAYFHNWIATYFLTLNPLQVPKGQFLLGFWNVLVLSLVLNFESFFCDLLASVGLLNKNGCKGQH